MNKQEALEWCAENLEEWSGNASPGPGGWAWHWTVNGILHLVRAGVGSINALEWKVARKEYLAKQKPQWNGEGLPPAGFGCEFSTDEHHGDMWIPGVVKYASENAVVFESAPGCEIAMSKPTRSWKFRLPLSERDKAIEVINKHREMYGGCSDYAEDLLAMLDKGHIPGYGKLEDK